MQLLRVDYVRLEQVEEGPFNRLVATVLTPTGESVGDKLLQVGLAHEEDGKSKQKGWCDDVTKSR